MSDTLRVSTFLISAGRAGRASAEEMAFIKGLKAFNWRPCHCVRCGDCFGPKRPRTFVAFRFPGVDGAKAYGICRQCEKAPDYEIMTAAGAYVQKLLGADDVEHRSLTRDYRVTVKVVIEHFATVTVRAHSQAAADEKAIDRYYKDAHTNEDPQAGDLGLPSPRWYEQIEPRTHEPVIDQTFRCVDCGKDTCGREYYMVPDELWAAAGMAPNGGMLCLADLERRIGRWLVPGDFTAIFPRDWARHVAAREAGGRLGDPADAAVQLDLLEALCGE